jgi:hypothetical protein
MHEVEKTPAGHRVKVSVGYTRNVGNPNPTFDKAYTWAEGKLLEKVAEVEAELKGAKE